MVRPNDLPNTSDYHLFKEGIKPMWEDDANRWGGKWLVRLKKGLASKYWEDLVRVQRWVKLYDFPLFFGGVAILPRSIEILSLRESFIPFDLFGDTDARSHTHPDR